MTCIRGSVLTHIGAYVVQSGPPASQEGGVVAGQRREKVTDCIKENIDFRYDTLFVYLYFCSSL